jgi:LmbE family N-acetylglucosaminyl deacetylase
MSVIEGPVLVVAAHPDDEVLGCGGTIARLTAAGVPVHVQFFTDGVSARLGAAHSDAADLRRQAAITSLGLLGVHAPEFFKFPDNRLDTVALLDLTQSLEQVLARVSPVTVLTHHAGDLNVDHRLVHEAVMTACRPQPGHRVRNILCFEVASSTEWRTPVLGTAFVPQLYIDISAHLSAKLEALDAYHMEMRAWPHARSPRAVEYLAGWRGAPAGVEAAEAFTVARIRL